MIDSVADAGWLAEIGALDAPGTAASVTDPTDALTTLLFADDPLAQRTAIGAVMDTTVSGGVDEFAARVLAHLAR